ncbi:MAG: hypothetical protein LQ340_005444 [Diploschistes diacapsis]|nr:MAG: hypothetical protein LQ340_005444 [Diploschistes diacapsis]
MVYLSRSSTVSSEEELQLALPPYIRALTVSQRKSLEEMKVLCRQNNVYWNMSMGDQGRSLEKRNDNVTFLRYLKGRDWNAAAAFKQYTATVSWRRKIQLEHMYRTADIEHFETISRMMPQWTGRRSRGGIPLFVYSVAKIRPEDLLRTSASDPTLSSVFLPAEYSSQFVQPLCAKMHPDGAMPCLMHIIDLTGVGVRHFWNLRAHLQKAAGIATSHYPESVDRIFIVGAPSFFPTIWGYITKWFDRAITSKISVLPAAKCQQVLTSHVYPEDLPRCFGGTLDWEYGMHPNVDRETRALLGDFGEQWVEGPLQYVLEEDSETIVPGEQILAVGSERDKQVRNTVVASLAPARRLSDECSIERLLERTSFC